MARRLGFTLIELLVVVAVIATLAGLLLPTIGLVKRLVNDVKCGNQLQQIAGAMEIYKGENDESFPNHLIGGAGTTVDSTDDLVHLGGALKGMAKLFRCPLDLQGGTDPLMGRPIAFMDDLSGIYDYGIMNGATVGSSYDFETSGNTLGALHAGSESWFYTATDEADAKSLLPTGQYLTWAMGKRNQLMQGTPGGTTYSGPFPPSSFPILRCYWHNKWTKKNATTDRKVKNVSWDLNVFNSIPYWEHEVNPAIPLPN